MKRIWIIALFLALPAQSQTALTIPATVAHSGFPGFGLNIGACNTYGNTQLCKNLTANRNLSFLPQTWAYMSVCNGGTTTTWIDQRSNGSSPQPAGWYTGATYQTVPLSGTGVTGSVTGSTAQTGGAGSTYTFSPALSAACSSSNPDMVLLRQLSPSVSWVGYETPANSGQYYGPFGSGLSYNTTDLHSGTLSTQSLEITGASSGIQAGFDGAYNGMQWINLNGSYTVSLWAKCKTSGSVTVLLQRGSATPYVNQTISPTCNATAGAGWQQYNYTFTASETGSQSGGVSFLLTTGTGTQDILLADMSVTEASTISGNTTFLRDAVYKKILAMNPGVLRFMDGGWWTCSFDNMVTAQAGMRPCGFNGYTLHAPSGLTYSLGDALHASDVLGAAPWFTMPNFSTVADAQHLVQYLNGAYAGNTTNWIALFAAKGQKIYIEWGNEVWNEGEDGANMDEGQGSPYGTYIGNNIAAAKATTGYTSSIVFIGSGRPGGQFGFCDHQLIAAGAVTNGQMDICDAQGYQFGSMTQTSSDAVVYNSQVTDYINNDTTTAGGIHQALTWNQTTYGVGTAIYETNMTPPNILTSTTQATVNDYIASIGAGLAVNGHMMTMAQQGALVQNLFILTGSITSLTSCTSTSGGCSQSGTVNAPLWGANDFMASGPSQSGFTDVDRPELTAFGVQSAALSAGNILALTQSGTPTLNQAASQPDPTNGGANSIAANTAVPLVQCSAVARTAGGIGVACYNWSSSSQAVTFTGADAPSGTTAKTIFGGTGQAPDNNCEGTALGSTCSASTLQTASLSSPTTDTLQPYSLTTYTYTVGGSSPAAAPTFSPVAGTYAATQTVSLASTTASPAFTYCTTTAGTTCTPTTAYTSALTVSSTEELCAFTTASGFTQSTTTCGAYYIIPAPAVPATPAFSPGGGTYTGTQTVSLSDATGGASIFYTANGQTPDLLSTTYSSPLTVSSTQTIKAVAALVGRSIPSAQTSTFSQCYIGSCAGGGTPGGTGTPSAVSQTLGVSSPSLSGAAQRLQFTTSQSNTNVLWYIKPGTLDTTANLSYNINAYPNLGYSQANAYEYDMGIYDAAGNFYKLAGTQWNKANGTWDIWNNNGVGWVHTSITASLSQAAWNNIQLSASADPSTSTACSGNPCVTYNYLVINGTTYAINQTEPSQALPMGFTSNTVFNVQVDGGTVSTSTVFDEYIDNSSAQFAGPLSSVASATYTITTQAAAPTFTPPASTYTGTQTVTIASSTSGASITYGTVSSGTCTPGTAYTGPVSIAVSSTLCAFANASGFTQSNTTSGAYVINSSSAPAPVSATGAMSVSGAVVIQ